VPASAEGDAGATGGERSFGSGARILSVGIAATGLFTFAYFSVARHVLGDDSAYGRVSLLWAVLFVIMSVIYRPVEQLLSRTIADRRARGLEGGHPLRTPATIQASLAAAFLVVALAFHGPIEDGLFDGEASLYWILIGAALAYAASYFARGYLAGHQWFGLYGGLVLFEALSRFCFPVAVAVGIASGETAVALGILAAPLASLLVIPWALRRHEATAAGAAVERSRGAMRASAGFAGAVAAIQLAEQTLLNAAVLLVPDSDKAGIVFSALLIARAPLQLFQAVQTSLLPHLAGLEATEGHEAFGRAIRQTVLVIAGFAGAVALGLLAIGPFVMDVVFPSDTTYGRVGLAVIAIGMGLHLTAGTLNQAALARGRAHLAAAAWLVAAGLFVIWMLVPVVSDELARAEVGYAGAAGVLCVMLYVLYQRRPAAAAGTS
jgi:O-antigen/teichoic acid export membrane protein